MEEEEEEEEEEGELTRSAICETTVTSLRGNQYNISKNCAFFLKCVTH